MTTDTLPAPTVDEAKKVTIIHLPAVPIAVLRKEVHEPAGDWTLDDVAEAIAAPRDGLSMSLDGVVIPRETWVATVPTAGQMLIVTTRPAGVEAAFLAAGAGLSALGVTGVTATYIAMVVSLVAVAGALYGLSRLATSLLAPDKPSIDATGPAVRRSIAGENNAFRPYDTIPQVLGRHRFYPPLAARSYSIVEDNKLHQYMLFTFGYGELELSELKIGDDPLFREDTVLSYTETMLADADKWVQKRDDDGNVTKSIVELQVRQGTDTDEPITLFAANVQEQVVGLRLRRIHSGTDDKTGKADPKIARTFERATRITVLIGCPSGLIWRTSSGKVKERTVILDVSYRSATAAADGAWTDVERVKMTKSSMSSQFTERTWEVEEGTYDVRISRRTEEGQDPGIIDQTEWVSMLTHRAGDVVAEEGLCLVAMKVQITDNFSRPVDQFNAVPQLVCPDWDAGGSSWVTRATSNPASLFRHVLQGPANKRPVADARINLTALQAWHVFCDSKGFEFNSVTQGRVPAIEVLRQIATAGRASPGLQDGLFSVVLEPAFGGAAVQSFTPRNVRSFREVRTYLELPHAFKVQWVDPDSGWLDTERIVPADGYTETTATFFERLDLAGVTNGDQAYKLGRYHLAVLQLRPSEYVLEVDFEHLDVVRGDLVRIAHDSILVGLAQGRVLSVTMSGSDCVGVVVDQECPMAAASYGIRFRKSDGSSVAKQVTTAAGNQTALTFSTPITSGNPIPVAGDLFMFGELNSEVIPCVVKEIEPLDDLGARLTLVDAVAGILTADSGTIPAYKPRITIPPGLNPMGLAKPRILSVSGRLVRDGSQRGNDARYGLRIQLQPSALSVQQ